MFIFVLISEAYTNFRHQNFHEIWRKILLVKCLPKRACFSKFQLLQKEVVKLNLKKLLSLISRNCSQLKRNTCPAISCLIAEHLMRESI